MAQSWPSTQLRARRVAFLCAALAFIAGAAFGLALLSATRDGITISNAAALSATVQVGRAAVVATFRTAPYATLVSAQATWTAQAAPPIVLDYRATGSDGTGPFTISGHAWKVELHCSTPSEGRSGTSATDVTVRVGIPNGGFTADGLGYQCPPGAPGDTSAGMANAIFHDTGVFYLYVDSGTNASVAWEVIVTDLP
jgi:hypothetical protein